MNALLSVEVAGEAGAVEAAARGAAITIGRSAVTICRSDNVGLRCRRIRFGNIAADPGAIVGGTVCLPRDPNRTGVMFRGGVRFARAEVAVMRVESSLGVGAATSGSCQCGVSSSRMRGGALRSDSVRCSSCGGGCSRSSQEICTNPARSAVCQTNMSPSVPTCSHCQTRSGVAQILAVMLRARPGAQRNPVRAEHGSPPNRRGRRDVAIRRRDCQPGAIANRVGIMKMIRSRDLMDRDVVFARYGGDGFARFQCMRPRSPRGACGALGQKSSGGCRTGRRPAECFNGQSVLLPSGFSDYSWCLAL